MNRKINMFTLMIFAYSIIICAMFKKEESAHLLSTAHSAVKPKLITVDENGHNPEKITASVTPVKNVNQ